MLPGKEGEMTAKRAYLPQPQDANRKRRGINPYRINYPAATDAAGEGRIEPVRMLPGKEGEMSAKRAYLPQPQDTSRKRHTE